MPNDELTLTAEFVFDTYRKLNEIEDTLNGAIETECNATKEGLTRLARQQIKELKLFIADRTFKMI